MKKQSNDGSWAKFLGEFCFTLTLIFCAMRACDVIQWDWYFVLLPTILYWVFCVVTVIVAIVLMAVAYCHIHNKSE